MNSKQAEHSVHTGLMAGLKLKHTEERKKHKEFEGKKRLKRSRYPTTFLKH